MAYGSVVLAAVSVGRFDRGPEDGLSGRFRLSKPRSFAISEAWPSFSATWWAKEGGAMKLTRRRHRLLGLLGLGVSGNHLLILMGLNYVSGAVGGVIIGSSPVVTALLSAMLIRGCAVAGGLGGGVLSFAGVGLVSVAGFQAAGERPLLGSTLVFLRGRELGACSIGSRTIMERISALTVNWTTLMVATVLADPTAVGRSKNDECRDRFGDDVRLAGARVSYYFCDRSGAAGLACSVSKGIGPSRASVSGISTPVAAIGLSA